MIDSDNANSLGRSAFLDRGEGPLVLLVHPLVRSEPITLLEGSAVHVEIVLALGVVGVSDVTRVSVQPPSRVLANPSRTIRFDDILSLLGFPNTVVFLLLLLSR